MVQRFFLGLGAAGTVILVFSAFLAIWDVFDINAYWRSLASILVIVFTALVCAGTAQLLEKYETPALAGGMSPGGGPKSNLPAVLRNSAGMVIICIYFLHGIFGFFAVWNSHDDIFMRLVLSAFTFLLGLLVLVAITGYMQYGRKQTESIYGGLYVLIIVLFVLILFGIAGL